MEGQDRDAVIAVALMAALADGSATSEEKAQLQAAMRQAGIADLDALTMKITTGQLRLQDLAARLRGDAARREAYELAVLVCHADGPANATETSTTSSHSEAGSGATSCASIRTGTAPVCSPVVMASTPGRAAPHNPFTWPPRVRSSSASSPTGCRNR